MPVQYHDLQLQRSIRNAEDPLAARRTPLGMGVGIGRHPESAGRIETPKIQPCQHSALVKVAGAGHAGLAQGEDGELSSASPWGRIVGAGIPPARLAFRHNAFAEGYRRVLSGSSGLITARPAHRATVHRFRSAQTK